MLVVQIDGPIGGNRTDGEFRVPGGADLPRGDDVERHVERVSDRPADGESPGGDGESDVGIDVVSLEQRGEATASVGTVLKHQPSRRIGSAPSVLGDDDGAEQPGSDSPPSLDTHCSGQS